MSSRQEILDNIINETQSMRLINGPDGYMYIGVENLGIIKLIYNN